MWSKLVAANDKVLLITPKYNHGLSAIEKNALDTLSKEWKDVNPDGSILNEASVAAQIKATISELA